MLVSVYTPTHDSRWLLEAYESLKDQTFQDWEWVIVPRHEHIPIAEEIRKDPRVRIHPLDDMRIGTLKSYAVEHCKGELLVELDHDDMLEVNCLARLAQDAALWRGQPAFFYSDCINFREDGTSETFSEQYGWSTYPIMWRGRQYQAVKAFPANARSLAEIEFAPNHVRAWTRAAYDKAGGYQKALTVADDHDLMCRTYLAGVPFVHINEVLYFYRRHEGNSFMQPHINEAIHQQSVQVTNAYLHAMVVEWCRREGLAMIDLGGAHGCPEGFIPLDSALPLEVPGIHADVFAALRGGMIGYDWAETLRDSKVGCFRATDFMEHIPSTRVPELMNGIWQALAHGGWLLTETPAVCDNMGRVGWGAFRDPTHVSFWTPDNWRYYTEADLAKYVPEIKCKFQEVRIWLDYPSPQHFQSHCPYLFADLCASKDGKPLPGGLRI